MEAIRVDISSSYGFFQWEKTKGDNRTSNLFISKTEVLGILGAVLGLDGYTQCDFNEKNKIESEPFYQVLSGLKVAIVPLTYPTFFEDHLIHRPMNAINTKGALMVSVTGLVRPHYRLFIAQGDVEAAVFERLKSYLLNDWAEFIPYMGKNHHPISFSEVSCVELAPVDITEPVVLRSIYKEKDAHQVASVSDFDLLDEEFQYEETLRTFQDNSPLYENLPHVWSSFPVQMAVSAYVSPGGEQIVFL